ncbi:MAG: 8-oxo-dGTP diphosphatase MutT [Pseudanabaenaceae cyanobacterium bins.68]|nr:8-oxo-dGTP diphosphatase MutT [Pseudanabaenaceae cyanobacterium bins.68]
MKKNRRVAVAIIWNHDRSQVLIDQRLPEGDFGGFWEFPGGKIEPNESAIACIEREIREELGIDIAVGEHLLTLQHEYEHLNLTLVTHHAQMLHPAQPIQAIACQQVRWVKIADLSQYQFPAANLAIIQALIDQL